MSYWFGKSGSSARAGARRTANSLRAAGGKVSTPTSQFEVSESRHSSAVSGSLDHDAASSHRSEGEDQVRPSRVVSGELGNGVAHQLPYDEEAAQRLISASPVVGTLEALAEEQRLALQSFSELLDESRRKAAADPSSPSLSSADADSASDSQRKTSPQVLALSAQVTAAADRLRATEIKIEQTKNDIRLSLTPKGARAKHFLQRQAGLNHSATASHQPTVSDYFSPIRQRGFNAPVPETSSLREKKNFAFYDREERRAISMPECTFSTESRLKSIFEVESFWNRKEKLF
jgi:hypothetical protein